MRALAKVSLLILCFGVMSTFWIPLINIPTLLLMGPISFPLWWYVLFTLPEERAQEYDIIRRLALGPESVTRAH